MKKLMNKVSGFMKNEEGQGLVEYALIIALISIVAIVALKIIGAKTHNAFNAAAEALP